MSAYKTQVRDRLWTILEGYAPFTTAFASARRLKKPSADATIREIMQRAPQDFPQIGISNGRFTDSGYTLPQKMTFEMEKAQTVDEVSDWIVQRKCEYLIIIRGMDQTTNLDDFEQYVQDALILAGPRLGIADIVVSWGPITAIQKPVKINNVSRNQSNLTLPVLMQFSGAGLRTELST